MGCIAQHVFDLGYHGSFTVKQQVVEQEMLATRVFELKLASHPLWL